MKKITYLTFIMIVAFMATISAQDFEKDLQLMAQAYGEMENFNIKIRVNTYKKIRDTRPMTSYEARASKEGNQFFYDMQEMTVLVNKKCMVVADKTQNLLTYTAVKKQQKKQKIEEIPIDLDLDEFSKQLENVAFLGVKNGVKIYKVQSPEKPDTSVELHIDIKSKIPSKMIYTYGADAYMEGSKIEVDYPLFDTKPQFQANTFSEDKFVTQNSAGEIEATAKYSGFRLMVNE